MKNILLFICLAVLVSGCATTEYFTNPNSAGYNEQGLGGLCQNCNREFVFSGYQLNNIENIICPYCGLTQNLKMASNRYTYAVQQQQDYNTQQALSAFAQGVMASNRQRAANQQKAIENLQKNVNQPGSWSNPIHVKVEK